MYICFLKKYLYIKSTYQQINLSLYYLMGFPSGSVVPAMQETRVQSLGREDPLEEGRATHSSILAWRITINRRTWQATVHGDAKSWT